MNHQYFKQVNLLLSILPDVMYDERLALKGGTALNLFVLNMPRLSVDIDLTYIPIEERNISLTSIDEIFLLIQKKLHAKGLRAILKSTVDNHHKQIVVEDESSLVKIEINHVLRGAVHNLEKLSLSPYAQEIFTRYMDINCLNINDLYAGKLCAMLDRKHPRDIFDIYHYLKNHDYTRSLHLTFLVYLISHNRPISELIKPNPPQNLLELYEKEFKGMVKENVDVVTLESTFNHTVELIALTMTNEEKEFLISFKSGNPKWNLLPFEHIKNMPAIRWKLYNIEQMDKLKHAKMLKLLETKLL